MLESREIDSSACAAPALRRLRAIQLGRPGAQAPFAECTAEGTNRLYIGLPDKRPRDSEDLGAGLLNDIFMTESLSRICPDDSF